jgi:rhodanese-related sulfurtransferase
MKAIVALVALLAASQAPPSTAPAKVLQKEFKRLAAAQKILIVDVRPVTAFRDGHIPRAMSLPLERGHWPAEYDDTVARLKAATKPIVLYCACSGETLSIQVADLLSEEGVKDLRVLVGGWNTWVNDGNRTAKGPK